MSNARNFFSPDEDKRVVDAILEAEKVTSGEIRVHLENRCKGDAIERAVKIFEKLGMHGTEARNGVLFYLAVRDHKFAIIGDTGIDEQVPDGFWDDVKNRMQSAFGRHEFVNGLRDGILETGRILGEHFPHAGDDDIDELPNELSFDEGE